MRPTPKILSRLLGFSHSRRDPRRCSPKREFCSSKIGRHNTYVRSVTGGGIAPHSPSERQLTRRNCPLLNCERVLWGFEADGQRLHGQPCGPNKRKGNLVHGGGHSWTLVRPSRHFAAKILEAIALTTSIVLSEHCRGDSRLRNDCWGTVM